MVRNSDNSISDLVQTDYRAAQVFKKYGINFCCGGNISLQAACKLRDLDYVIILNELEEATREIRLPNILRFDQWKINFLVDYIVNVHHAYLYQAVTSLELHLASFLEGHKKKYPGLLITQEILLELSDILLVHNHYEEEIIFPYIKQIDIAYGTKAPYGNLIVKTLRKSISATQEEHIVIIGLLDKLKLSANNYVFPDKACTNHQVLYHKLKEFHNDLIQHKHLENNILFPRAIDIELELLRF